MDRTKRSACALQFGARTGVWTGDRPDPQAIRDEAASWLDSLNATVRGGSVRPAD
jgi:hypothetical protein